MKTDDLLNMLSSQLEPAPRAVALNTLLPVAVLGCAIAGFLAIIILGRIPPFMLYDSAVWVKMSYALALTLTAGSLITQLGKPGVAIGKAKIVLPLIFLSMEITGTISYFLTPAEHQKVAFFGHSWLICPWLILGLSLPALFGSLWAAKQLAPTRLRLTGAACGLFAGAIGALGYAFACTEAALTFIAIWYTLGITLSAVLGAILGPKFLRW
jgi:hypothetical protein